MSLEDDIIKRIKRILQDKGFLEKIGEEAVALQKGTIRTGKNLDGEKFQFKDKKKAIKRREAIVKAGNKPHPTYSKGRANVTITGEFVDSITFDVEVNSSTITIKVDGTHKGYLNKDGSRGKSVPNKEILKGLNKKGFNVLAGESQLEKRLSRKIKEELRRRLRNTVS